jgi:hypothetical protein
MYRRASLQSQPISNREEQASKVDSALMIGTINSDKQFYFSVDFPDFERFLQWLAVDRLNPGGQLVLPAMPGAGHTPMLQLAFGNRASLMCTHPIHGKQLALTPE